jgi:hypothetical protein
VALNLGTKVLISRIQGHWGVTLHLSISGFFMAHKTLHMTATHSSETPINTRCLNPLDTAVKTSKPATVMYYLHILPPNQLLIPFLNMTWKTHFILELLSIAT